MFSESGIGLDPGPEQAAFPSCGMPTSVPDHIAITTGRELDRRTLASELERELTELAGHLNAAHHRFLSLLWRFDRANGWHGAGILSCAHWLNWKCGIDQGAAREKIRVAHALDALPRIGAAMAAGELSYSKVRALTRVATPATEETLLMIARHGTAAHVERVVRGFRRAQHAAELAREARQFETRSVSWYHDDDGSLVLKARLPAEGGAVLIRALESACLADRPGRVSAETPEGSIPDGIDHAAGADATSSDTPAATFAQRRADALGVIAESFLKTGPASLGGGERHQVIVHVDATTLASVEPGRCELEGGPAIAAQTARRLACDASRITVREDARGEPLDVGRRTRTIPAAIGRALRIRDQGCRFPGCTHTRFVDGHHIEHWADGGATRLSNLVLLCRRHHRLVHEGGVTVTRLDDGALRFRRPDGTRLDDHPPLSGNAAALGHHHAYHGPHIWPHTAVTRWCGERLDNQMAVSGLMAERAREARADPAGG